MKVRTQCKFQIGKGGLTDGIIDSLDLCFKTHKVVRISVLKGAGDFRKKMKDMAKELAGKLSGDFSYKVIGFTIVMKKINLKN